MILLRIRIARGANLNDLWLLFVVVVKVDWALFSMIVLMYTHELQL